MTGVPKRMQFVSAIKGCPEVSKSFECSIVFGKSLNFSLQSITESYRPLTLFGAGDFSTQTGQGRGSDLTLPTQTRKFSASSPNFVLKDTSKCQNFDVTTFKTLCPNFFSTKNVIYGVQREDKVKISRCTNLMLF